ncbi:MAG: Hpt domain-containing protein, partial [Deltaproteobacteria bacterium]
MTEETQNIEKQPSIHDLFQQEVETHGAVLKDGLAALEGDSHSPEQLHPLVRSIHSIKGGALIVDNSPAVALAAVIEDCLTSAQKG